MTWVELNRLEDDGHEIANHSMTHRDLRSATTSGLYWQVERSSQILEEHLGARPRTLVYPYGFWDDRVVTQVAASRFRMAFTTVNACGQSWTRRFVAPRVRVNNTTTAQQVLSRIAPCA